MSREVAIPCFVPNTVHRIFIYFKMTPNEITEVKPYDIRIDDEPEISDDVDVNESDLDSDEDEIRLDREVAEAEAEAIEALRITKAEIDELNRKSLIMQEDWNNWKNESPGLCDNIELIKEDPRWITLSAIVIAEYHQAFLLDGEVEMIVLKRYFQDK